MSFRQIPIVAVLPTVLILLAPPAVAQDRDNTMPIATVNGRPIERYRVVNLLMESHGLEILTQLMAYEMAVAEAERRGLTVTEADEQAEFENALDEIAGDAEMSHADKLKAIENVLEQRRISLEEFRLGMRRNAYLRKIVNQDLRISEKTLREAFERRYGARLVIRHIQLKDFRVANRVLDQLDQGVPFDQLARRMSVNEKTAGRGGLMEPFAYDVSPTKIPPALRDLAFSLGVGEVGGPVRTGEFVHVVRVEDRLPPENLKFEDVRQRIEESIRETIMQEEMNKLAEELFQKARIRILDRRLEREFREMLKEKSAATPKPGSPGMP